MSNSPRSISPFEVHGVAFSRILDIRSLAASMPSIRDAVPVTADEVASHPEQFIPSTATRTLIVCDIGIRSAIVTDLLRAVGYGHAVSLDGGMEGWLDAGLPVDAREGLTPEQYRRYDRQLKVPDFGVTGQQALNRAGVAVVGAGGLGAPVLAYLAGVGVGRITVIDSDEVQISNLHRQPIYTAGDVGSRKAATAASFISALNPTVEVDEQALHLDGANAEEMLAGHDIVVTCTDSFETAHAINAAAVKLGIPMVFGSVYRTEGQLSVFDAAAGPCYACVFPSNREGPAQNCSIVGVLGPVTGVIGSMQAAEVVKLLTGIGEPSIGRLGLYDAGTQTMDTVTIRKNRACAVCGPSTN